ncbi:hypothetical protein K7432_000190 [Basidiobolus ranarum]|uniref:BHLH domain-containing protein n=1 Tax=Basidiobolus ranarum TaxID=34480 RepID=A0ABR2X4Z6_9FUNG
MDSSLHTPYDFPEFDLNLINEFSLDNTDINLLSQIPFDNNDPKPAEFLHNETPNTQHSDEQFQYSHTNQHSTANSSGNFLDNEEYRAEQNFHNTPLTFSTALNTNYMPSPQFNSNHQNNHNSQLPTPSSSGQLTGSNDCAFMSPFAFFDHSGAVVEEGLDGEEILFTPLVSPAMTPSQPYSNSLSASFGSEVFSPLTSPALGPSQAKKSRSYSGIPNLSLGGSLIQSMAQPTPPRSKSLLTVREDTRSTDRSNPSKTKLTTSRTVSQRKKPYPERRLSTIPSSLSTSTTTISETSKESIVSPITPASIMKLDENKGPQKESLGGNFPHRPLSIQLPLTSPSLGPSLMMSPTITAIPASPALSSTFKSPGLKPLISPNLKSLLPGGGANDVAMKLASKSNYQNILEGNTASLGLKYSTDVHSGIELRRTSHKAAEQKRRDSLKQCFENLKNVIPEIDEKAPSKAYLLKKSYDHILRLEMQVKERDKYIVMLREQLQSNGMIPNEPEIRVPNRISEEDDYKCTSESPHSSLDSTETPILPEVK